MRANSDRSLRLAFDRVADDYAAARPAMPAEAVAAASAVAGLQPGDHVLEVGAGTGQLTAPLRAAGLRVTALEPGGELRKRLAARFAGDDAVAVRGEIFEEYRGDEPHGAPFTAIASANAFQWVDPAVGYRRAAELLANDGHLILMWNHPMLRPDLQRMLNIRVFADGHPDFVRDPDRFEAQLAASAADGRDELVASGYFSEPWWQTVRHTFPLEADGYVALLASYANAAALGDAERTRLAARVRETLSDAGVNVGGLEIVNQVYVCVARLIP